VPFVQGGLRGQYIAATVTSECAYCHQPLHIEIDSELKFKVIEKETRPVVFAPLKIIDPKNPSIIDGF
jgi:hypothetical protein